MKLIPVIALALFVSACGHITKTNKGADGAKVKSEKPVSTAKLEGEIFKTYTCVNGKDTRIVAVEKLNKSCRVSYTKFGKTTFPAESKGNDMQFCLEKCDKIKANLENNGHKCQ
jgi:hypothetical protein